MINFQLISVLVVLALVTYIITFQLNMLLHLKKMVFKYLPKNLNIRWVGIRVLPK